MKPKDTVAVVTFGCQMNEYDTLKIKGILAENQYRVIDDYEKADVILLNTCAVREKSEHKVFSLIGRLMQIKRKREHLLIGVGGCSAEVSRDYLLKHFPKLDILFTPANYMQIASIIEKARNEGVPVHDAISSDEEELVGNMFENCGATASVSIMRGCDNNCAYCIVPRARGAEVSRNPEIIMQEIQLALENGAREIILLGQNVNSYRFGETTFPSLLQTVAETSGIERLRFVTSHPKDISDELISVMQRNRNICRNVHLPLQAGSDATLKGMNRGYTYSHYRELIGSFRAAMPEMTFSTDIIVGFPGETKEDFEKTSEAVQEIGFDQIYLFKYSVRPGTSAADLEDDVPPEEKQRRFEVIHNFEREFILQRNLELVNRVQQVLVTGISKKNENRFSGRTEENKVVNFKGTSETKIGDILDVVITAGYPNSLDGEIAEARQKA